MKKMIFPSLCDRSCKNICRDIITISVDLQLLDKKDIISWDRVFHYAITMKDNSIVEYIERDVDIFGQIINIDKESNGEKGRCVMTCTNGNFVWMTHINKLEYGVFCNLSANEMIAINTTNKCRKIRPLWFVANTDQ